MATGERLQEELRTYDENKDRLVAESEGKFVVIHKDQIAGVWDTYEDALTAAYERFGLEAFLVKRIQSIEQVQFISRDITPCQF
jgi:hypothetical protein